MPVPSNEYLQGLVRELSRFSTEVEWVEFKCNNKDPEMIGQYISAISNSAALCERPKGYLVWGIDDVNHKLVGTNFVYRNAKKGNEELEAWLSRVLNPRIDFKFYEVMIDGKAIVLLEIPCAESQPTQFLGVEYVRVGSNKKKLKEYPDKERFLWQSFDKTSYELRVAKESVTQDILLEQVSYASYYDKLEVPLPKRQENILMDFEKEKFIRKNDAGLWNITNMGALMIAKNLKNFEGLSRKTIRVIWYKGTSKLETIREKEFVGGYATIFDDVVDYIMTIIPQEEVIVDATRKSILSFPEIAIRELLANTMIHQDFQQRGTNPMVEVYSNRIEFSNAGSPLVPIERIIDTVPVSRNENIAGFMHKCGICEERGSGYDKIIDATGQYKLIAPRIENQNNQFTRVVLFSRIPFDVTTKEDRVRTCYMQACLAYVEFNAINNTSIRSVFGLEDKDKVKASRIIKDTVTAGLIKVLDPDTAPRYIKYVPYWV